MPPKKKEANDDLETLKKNLKTMEEVEKGLGKLYDYSDISTAFNAIHSPDVSKETAITALEKKLTNDKIKTEFEKLEKGDTIKTQLESLKATADGITISNDATAKNKYKELKKLSIYINNNIRKIQPLIIKKNLEIDRKQLEIDRKQLEKDKKQPSLPPPKQLTHNEQIMRNMILQLSNIESEEDANIDKFKFDNLHKTVKTTIIDFLKRTFLVTIHITDVSQKNEILEPIKQFLNSEKIISDTNKKEFLKELKKGLINIEPEPEKEETKKESKPEAKKGGYYNQQGGVSFKQQKNELIKTTTGIEIHNKIIEIEPDFFESKGSDTANMDVSQYISNLGINIPDLKYNSQNIPYTSINGQNMLLSDIVNLSGTSNLQGLKGYQNLLPGGLTSRLGELATEEQKKEESDRLHDIFNDKDRQLNKKIEDVSTKIKKLLDKITTKNTSDTSFERMLYKVDDYLYNLVKTESIFATPKMNITLPIIIENKLDTTYNPSSIKKTPDGVSILESQLAAERINSTSTYKNIMNVKYTILKTYSDKLQLQTTAFPTINNGVYSQPSGLNSIVSNKDNSIIPLARAFFLNQSNTAKDLKQGVHSHLQYALTAEIITQVFESFTTNDGILNVAHAIKLARDLSATEDHFLIIIKTIKQSLQDIIIDAVTTFGNAFRDKSIDKKQGETNLFKEGLFWFHTAKETGISSIKPTYDFATRKYSIEYENYLKLTPT